MSEDEAKRAALEHLRTADRILEGLIGSLRSLLAELRQPRRNDPRHDGPDTVVTAESELQHAWSEAFQGASGLRGDMPPEPIGTGWKPGFFAGIWAALTYKDRAGRLLGQAESLRANVRRNFERGRASVPSLSNVAPLDAS